MNYFDANAMIGCSTARYPELVHVSDLLAHMDWLGISRALVWDVAACDFHTRWGNQHLLEGLDATPGAAGRVFPEFVITPNMLHERGAVDWLRETMEARQVRALRYPLALGTWALDEIEPVLERLLDLQPALFLKLNEWPKAAIVALAERYPRLPIAICEVMWGSEERALDLMRRCENLLIETSWIHTHLGVERFVRAFGAERVLFGTGFKSHQGASLATLALAEIREPEREAVAHGNLERLLGLPASSAPAVEPSPGLAPQWGRLLRGEKLGREVIDVHGHLGPLASYVMSEADLAEQARQSLAWMDRSGVSTMIISGGQALMTESVEGNRALEEGLAPFGERFRGYLGYNPFYAEALEPLIEDFFSRPFWVGFKLLCDYWRVPVTDARFIPVWEYAHAHRLPILLHTWGGTMDGPDLLADIAPAYPEAAFLLGHSGGSDRAGAEVLAQANPNVYLEWCGSFTAADSWEVTLARVGAEHVVFGSDAIPHRFDWEIGRLLSQPFTEAQLDLILGANMRGLLERRR